MALPDISIILDPLGFLQELTSLTISCGRLYTPEETAVYQSLIAQVKAEEITPESTLPTSEALANDLIARGGVDEDSMIRVYNVYTVPPLTLAELEAKQQLYLAREKELIARLLNRPEIL